MPLSHLLRRFGLGVALATWAGLASAQSVAMTGGMGKKALLVIDGGLPKALAVGETHQGVRVIHVSGDTTTVEMNGQRQTVTLGGAPVSVGGRSSGGGDTVIVLTASRGGHFLVNGTINGRGAQFMVDTGATMVAMSEAEAKRLGLAYQQGQPMMASTANGVTKGYRITLPSVRINGVEVHQVEAAVLPLGMPHILLGNSFLSRFQMNRENDTMTLTRRF